MQFMNLQERLYNKNIVTRKRFNFQKGLCALSKHFLVYNKQCSKPFIYVIPLQYTGHGFTLNAM